MSIRSFEYYHGAVLTKILRKDSKTTLTLVQSKPKKNWAQYVINDDLALTIICSATPHEVQQEPKGTSWHFNIPDSSGIDAKYASHYALVGGNNDVGWKNAIICVLNPQRIGDLGLTEKSRTVTVRKPALRGQLLVFRDKKIAFRVPQGAINSLPISP